MVSARWLQVSVALACLRVATSMLLRGDAGPSAVDISNSSGDLFGGEGFWPQYPDRQVQSLAGDWEYCFLPGTQRVNVSLNISSACNSSDVTGRGRKRVPSVMHNPPPGEVPPTGTGVYAKDLTIEAGRRGLLHFAGCAFTCRVYVDEVLLVDHQSGGYSPFWVKVPPSNSTARRLFVLAERLWQPDIAPVYWMNAPGDVNKGINVLRTAGGDMTHWGGLHRNVFFHELPATTWYLKRAVVTPKPDLESIRITLRLEASLHKRMAFGKKGDTIQVRLRFDGASEEQVIPAELVEKYGSLKFDVAVPKAKQWSPKTPNLHTVHISLAAKPGEGSDSMLVRFGLRRIEATKDGLFLNGERIRLKGVNRHSTTPASGSALTMEEIRRDVDLIQELGVNFVRGAHYHQDQRFLDLLDERGIMAWEEPLTWANSEDRLLDSKYQQEMMNSVKEMLDASFNHPSIIIWGLFNEGPANRGNASCGVYKMLADKIRSRDRTRMITWANPIGYSINHVGGDHCEKLVDADIIAFNNYPGWYSGGEFCGIGCLRDAWRRTIAWQRRKTSKPIMVSEFGAEGVWELPGKARDPQPYTQEYQAQLLEASIDALSDIVDGIAVWQFTDIRGSDANTKLTNWEYWENRRDDDPLPDYYMKMPLDDHGSVRLMPRCKDKRGTFPEVEECGEVQFHGTKSLRAASRVLRPKGLNNKGIVDWWRRKKLAFGAVKRAYARY
uniref:Beta-glucuronidase n=1 Tax=Alexandrium catenella TaxID=2925 RepID=A0A7S1QSN7_ALECA|mmetsp:Transcript_37901/g.102628  ORF Transcript_37901/g.102628 Transcript_37901/m.102628 type:complete len:723 (+) Transcript_37901:98-2266(+)